MVPGDQSGTPRHIQVPTEGEIRSRSWGSPRSRKMSEGLYGRRIRTTCLRVKTWSFPQPSCGNTRCAMARRLRVFAVKPRASRSSSKYKRPVVLMWRSTVYCPTSLISTSISPEKAFRLADEPGAELTLRVLDLVAPIGKGQRGPHCVSAQGRQDDDPRTHRTCHRQKSPGSAPHAHARRRAA